MLTFEPRRSRIYSAHVYHVGLAMLGIALLPRVGHAIPPWARKYNMNCSGCHQPVVPRLNATGILFKWFGYRMPNEIGDKMEVKKIEEYLGARGEFRYSLAKTQGSSADVNSLSATSASLFAAGPIGKNYGAFIEFERTEEGSVDLSAVASGIWGKENSFGGVRVGQGHMMVIGGVAGLDRAIGVLAPLPLSDPTTATGIPFTFTGDVTSIEAFYVLGSRNRTSIQFANGLSAGGDMGGARSTKKDWMLTNQYMWDDAGSGLSAVAYYGSIAGLDTGATDRTAHYYRVALTASKIIDSKAMGSFEALGGYVYSKDKNLPVSATSSFTTMSQDGSAYWVSGQYSFPKSHLTLYSRYEFLNPNTDASDAGTRRVVLGGVLPFNLPEYFRTGVEYFRDTPRSSGMPYRHGAAAHIQVAF